MATIKITKRVVDQLKPDGKRKIIWDAIVVGFGMRCRANGRKYFVVKYRFDGRQRWLTIGQYGSPWSVDQARTQALKLLGEVASGRDPAAIRDLNKNANTVSELCDVLWIITRVCIKNLPVGKPTKAISEIMSNPLLVD